MSKKLTQEEILKRAFDKHGDKYIYNEVNWNYKSREKIKIICKIHGPFYKTVDNHINRGEGCKHCSREWLDTKKFIDKALNIHGGEYNYDQLKYKNIKTKVKIFCNRHEKYFYTKPINHLNTKSKLGKCPDCIKEEDTREFLESAIAVHGDKYGYDKVNYINTSTKVKIYCKTHKKYFKSYPYQHIRGVGCSRCSNNRKKDTEEFIKDAKVVHGNKYIYDRVNYINAITKVEIYCKIHKKYFEVTPNSHLSGSDCKDCGNVRNGRCNLKKHQYNTPCVLYYLEFTNPTTNEIFYKIGNTANIKGRISQMSKIYNISTLHLFHGKRIDMIILEEKLHLQYHRFSYRPKHNFGGGHTECYNSDILPHLMSDIEGID